jgi:hypothetical protein
MRTRAARLLLPVYPAALTRIQKFIARLPRRQPRHVCKIETQRQPELRHLHNSRNIPVFVILVRRFPAFARKPSRPNPSQTAAAQISRYWRLQASHPAAWPSPPAAPSENKSRCRRPVRLPQPATAPPDTPSPTSRPWCPPRGLPAHRLPDTSHAPGSSLERSANPAKAGPMRQAQLPPTRGKTCFQSIRGV